MLQKQKTTTARTKFHFAFFASGSRNHPRFFYQPPAFHALQKTNQNINCVNLSNIKLSATVSSLLEIIIFCPSHKLDQDKLCHDINEFTSFLRNNEFLIQKILPTCQTDQRTLSKQPQTGYHLLDATIT